MATRTILTCFCSRLHDFYGTKDGKGFSRFMTQNCSSKAKFLLLIIFRLVIALINKNAFGLSAVVRLVLLCRKAIYSLK